MIQSMGMFANHYQHAILDVGGLDAKASKFYVLGIAGHR
jgi:activator of 2-hydroxyglutaryl-CoA dehydratase